MEALCTPGGSLQDDGGCDEDMDGDDGAVAAEALKGVALVSTTLLAEHGKNAPDALLEAAAALHDSALLVRACRYLAVVCEPSWPLDCQPLVTAWQQEKESAASRDCSSCPYPDACAGAHMPQKEERRPLCSTIQLH